ncbi:hypothetical protein ACFT30_06695 [Microbacterium ureisolvens]|uniref:hypothetical protein n=1 Tax=Microbacterium ureisolvens TaxID=2781186 RepID=UPI00363BB0BD
MSRRPTPVIGAAVVAALLLSLPAGAAASVAEDGQDDGGDQAANTALIEVPFGEPGELRVAEGTTVDCAVLAPVEGLGVSCEPSALVLTVDAYDPEWGERVLPVTLVTGEARTVVHYRVALAPPPAPEIGSPRVDAPFAAGGQALVPLSLLGITCTLCTVDAAAVSVESVTPASAHAGVGGAHLAVRSDTPGDVTVVVAVEDDAGQTTTAEVIVTTVSTAAGTDAAARALHVLSAPARTLELSDLAWGDDLSFSCLAPVDGVACGPDGSVSFAADPRPGDQLAFRVVDAQGFQALGSVTFADEPGGEASVRPAPVDWSARSALGITVPAPPADDADTGAAVLTRLTRILEEVPAS